MDHENQLESQIANLSFLEELYSQTDGADADPSWAAFFRRFDQANYDDPRPSTGEGERIAHLIEAYRKHGHLLARVNPITVKPSILPENLKLDMLSFQAADQEKLFPTLGLLSDEQAPLRSILDQLQKLYCQSVGFEFKDYLDKPVEQWIQQEIEKGRFIQPVPIEEKKTILDFLTRAEGLETFLHMKHVGKKRFSLEGAETLIPMLSFLIAHAAEDKVEEFYIGMSHRGRLNVLANILNKPIDAIFKDFDDEYLPAPSEGMGDIRYHKGHANESVNTYRGKPLKLEVAPNPSHLESVNPVVEGKVHAQQYLKGDEESRRRIIPLLTHGDGALSGQGVVYETLQMSRLHGFETGGTLHIVLNNQIGFTTSPEEGRSTPYCTDIAKTFKAPVFHVNAEEPEVCVRVLLFAYEIRQRFHCDVFVDLNCYRKYGHNEGDEPAFTQPLEYRLIRGRPSIRSFYLERLIKEGVVNANESEALVGSLNQNLQEAYHRAIENKNSSKASYEEPEVIAVSNSVKTSVSLAALKEVADCFGTVPASFTLNGKVKALFHERSKAVHEENLIDWGTAELLAYGTLVCQGRPVRLAGQDSGRGTFSHRHALWVDQQTSQPYYPLSHIRKEQARFEVLNTALSEVAALGFEYGYSTVCTEGLTLWEAQFGDFVNSAQVVIDQYIASGEQKWGQTSNLTLLLPHGFEGQGPEHSSARLERFLSLAGHDNMQIVYPTTPAQFFHLIRRQTLQTIKKPLIVLTPKGLLRHPCCTSSIKELTEGRFFTVLGDSKPKKARRLLLCSGRIYYDLEAYREKEKIEDVAIIRIEQLYPLDLAALKALLAAYKGIKKWMWVQEEPENMGAWSYLSFYLPQVIPEGAAVEYVGRERSATPATGFFKRHQQELSGILHHAFT